MFVLFNKLFGGNGGFFFESLVEGGFRVEVVVEGNV